MTNNESNKSRQKRSLYILAMVNTVIWAIAIIGMVFLMQHSPAVKKLFPILAGGTATSIALISTIERSK